MLIGISFLPKKEGHMPKMSGGAIAVMFVFLCGLLLACPAVAQDFNSKDWEIRLPGPGSGVQHTGEGVALMFRPHLVSKTEWRGSLSFSWEPPKLPEKADDGRIYGDHLVVFLASDGTFREERSYEVKTGIAVRLDSVTGDISITQAVDGVSFEVIKTTKGNGPLQGPHDVKVEDKEGTITVFIDGKSVVSAAIPAAARKGTVWGLYNREPVGNGRNISLLKKIVYTP